MPDNVGQNFFKAQIHRILSFFRNAVMRGEVFDPRRDHRQVRNLAAKRELFFARSVCTIDIHRSRQPVLPRRGFLQVTHCSEAIALCKSW